MGKTAIWNLRPEDWLISELNAFANIHGLDNRTETLHKYLKALKATIETQKNEIAALKSEARAVPVNIPAPEKKTTRETVFCQVTGGQVLKSLCEGCQRNPRIYQNCPLKTERKSTEETERKGFNPNA